MADGTPAKAVLKRLINGGGKTSAIKLISAIFEPDLKRLDRGPRRFRELFGSKVGIVAAEMTVDWRAGAVLFEDFQPRQIVGYAAGSARRRRGRNSSACSSTSCGPPVSGFKACRSVRTTSGHPGFQP